MITLILVAALQLPAPLVYYPFDGDCLDASGNGHDCTLVNGAGFDTGETGQALSLDGISQHASLSSLPTSSGDWSVAATIFPTASGDREIVSRAQSTREARLAGVNLRGCSGSGSIACGTSTVSVPLSVWSDVAVTYDDTARTIRVYLDGLEVASGTGTVATADASGVLTVGLRSTGDRAFAGRIDEFRWYNVTLSAADVANLAGGGPPADTEPPSVAAPSVN